MDRRRLLQLMAAAPLVLGGHRLYAAPAASGNRLLVVFMRGAYDATNLLVPVTSDFYYESRPSIAIGRPGGGPGSALPLSDGWGLHPALGESLLPFYERRELAFVPFAGTEDTYLSTVFLVLAGFAPATASLALAALLISGGGLIAAWERRAH